ncbi:hypothetical protein DSO57_1002826 [Entomophthora muscae]|uniref:Uncharacterized protein n=1 Tax=Entomophthora muscae TaxID=34485 RepID=A0ACC2RZQ8_9FUNG|nr:hypothetical protein DSO57_1002826 [Entomophthora muscae]
MRGLALYDCQADDPQTELSFKKGEIFSQLKPSTERGWFSARKQGASEFKLVPENYVKIIADAPPPVQPKPQLNLQASKKSSDISQLGSALKKVVLDNGQPANVKDIRSLFENQKVNDFKEDLSNQTIKIYSAKPTSAVFLNQKVHSPIKEHKTDPFGDSFYALKEHDKSQTPPKGSSNDASGHDSTINQLPVDIYQKISSSDRQKYLGLFNSLDKSSEGYLDGATVRGIWLRSNLELETLAQIWDLLDPKCQGSLSASSFAIGLYIIDKQLAGIPWSKL